MKPKKRETYVYKSKQFVGHYPTIYEAALATHDKQASIRNIMEGKQPLTMRGFFYSDKKLTQEEIDNIPTLDDFKGTRIHRHNEDCKERVEHLEFDVDCTERRVFYLSQNKEGRKAQLRTYINSRLQDYWAVIPKTQAVFEKRFLREVIDSL